MRGPRDFDLSSSRQLRQSLGFSFRDTCGVVIVAIDAFAQADKSSIQPYTLAVRSIFRDKRIAMESIISDLVSLFEKGSLSRLELVRGLAMLAASGTAAAAQEDPDFKSANIDHVSIQVADLQRSIDFYQKMFGFSVVS